MLPPSGAPDRLGQLCLTLEEIRWQDLIRCFKVEGWFPALGRLININLNIEAFTVIWLTANCGNSPEKELSAKRSRRLLFPTSERETDQRDKISKKLALRKRMRPIRNRKASYVWVYSHKDRPVLSDSLLPVMPYNTHEGQDNKSETKRGISTKVELTLEINCVIHKKRLDKPEWSRLGNNSITHNYHDILLTLTNISAEPKKKIWK